MKEGISHVYDTNQALIERIGKEQKMEAVDLALIFFALVLAAKGKNITPFLFVFAAFKLYDFASKQEEKKFLKTFQPLP